jgi:hypothetical protein
MLIVLDLYCRAFICLIFFNFEYLKVSLVFRVVDRRSLYFH